jgi:hypothetical protein
MSGSILTNNFDIFIQIDNHEQTNKKAVKDLEHQTENVLPLSYLPKGFDLKDISKPQIR